MRILIIKTSALGDIIHALPVLPYLQEAAPGAEIDWVVEEAFQDLLSGNPAVRRLITVPFKRWKKERAGTCFSEMRAVVSALRETRYDLVLDLQGNLKSGILCLLARSPRKIGYSREHLQERLNVLATTERISFRKEDTHVSQRTLRIVSAPFELAPDSQEWQGTIATSPEDDAHAARLLAPFTGDGPVILFHTGTTWVTKLWYDQGWQVLGEMVLARHPRAVILFSWGNRDEQERGVRIASALGGRALVLEQLNLKRFAAVMKRCSLVVGGDTGPIHLAAAVGTPTLSFYRCTDGERNGPFGSRHRIVQSQLPCARCQLMTCERDAECRTSITPDAMYTAVEKILGESP